MKKTTPLQLNNWEDFEVFHNTIQDDNAKSQYESFEEFCKIVEQLPKKELINRGWIESKNDIKSMVSLFQSINKSNSGTLFRKSNTSNSALCAAWQNRVAEIAKLSIYANRVNDFSGIDKKFLKTIAKLSPDVGIIKKLPEIVLNNGIILVYEKALPRMKLDGVVFKLESGHPVVGISFRFSRIDNFWFTLMHELAHIFLHYNLLENPIFDDLEGDTQDVIEIRANRLAKNSIVEKALWRNCKAKYSVDDNLVIEFASKVNIHPAIIAGMLQKEANTYNIYRKITDKVNIREEVFGNE